jgi:hypothetical protein
VTFCQCSTTRSATATRTIALLVQTRLITSFGAFSHSACWCYRFLRRIAGSARLTIYLTSRSCGAYAKPATALVFPPQLCVLLEISFSPPLLPLLLFWDFHEALPALSWSCYSCEAYIDLHSRRTYLSCRKWMVLYPQRTCVVDEAED